MKQAKQTNLGKKLLIGSIQFALIFIVLATTVVVPYTYMREMKVCEETAFSYARTAAKMIDGDRISDYLEITGYDKDGNPTYTTDEYYDEIMTYLNITQTEYDLMKYFYVFVPNSNDMTYIWDSENETGSYELGYTESYNVNGGKEVVARVYNTNPVEKIAVFEDETYGNIACAYYPIFNSEGVPVAVAGVDLSMERIKRTVIHNLLVIDIFIILATLIIILIGYSIIKRKVVHPIRRLNSATKSMIENLDQEQLYDLDIHTHDELEDLANSFGKMNSDLRDYLKKLESVTAEKERISTELSIAAQIQEDMLPREFPPFPDKKEFDIFASMTPAKEVGGDFYDFFLVDDNHIALLMADVSGKGVPAALFMAITKTLIKNRAQIGGTPSEILRDVNNQLCENNRKKMFVTVWLAMIDITTGEGVSSNAGHEHPALGNTENGFELQIYKHSPAVSVMKGIPYRQREFKLTPGDILFVYTDGVPEAANSENELYGTDRMLNVLNQQKSTSIKEMISALHKDIEKFVGDAPRFDDITMLAFLYKGK